jgi:hypothetical protein
MISPMTPLVALSWVRPQKPWDHAILTLRIRNSVTECAFLAPVIARRFCNGSLISRHFHRPAGGTLRVGDFSGPIALPASH